MKHTPMPLLLVLLFLPSCQAQERPKAPDALPPIQVYFSPNGGCTDAAVKEINAAKTTILVQAYSFTSAPIAKALVDVRHGDRNAMRLHRMPIREPQLEGFRRDFERLAIGRRKVSAADDLLLEAIDRNAVVYPHRLALGRRQVAQSQDDRLLQRRPGGLHTDSTGSVCGRHT